MTRHVFRINVKPASIANTVICCTVNELNITRPELQAIQQDEDKIWFTKKEDEINSIKQTIHKILLKYVREINHGHECSRLS